MKISIITVCKNAETAIERTLLSVVSQNCFNENIEYIVIDGASTDKTVEIIKQYSNKYPIKWISEPDSGIYNAMNKAVKMASGDYLLFLNAGDYLVHYNVIKSLMNLFERNTCDVICGKILAINTENGQYQIPAIQNNLYFIFYNSMPHQAMFYKKYLFHKFGFYDENFNIIADSVFNKKILYDEHGSINYVDQIVSVFFMDGLSSEDKNSNARERKKFQEQCFTKDELHEIKKQDKKLDILKSRQNKKSILRFLAKILIKIHEFWVNR